eukprot:TRINITY_DN1741_c0_g1_i2.p1 TRINITY_DN1741_c0_g1~~TRINITY_DN1741_c0_g1_i2.p1  ORF type:complete len:110 (+),score=10.71 TRINITY_DN1741_c0_g1_i2:820-1149(+)
MSYPAFLAIFCASISSDLSAIVSTVAPESSFPAGTPDFEDSKTCCTAPFFSVFLVDARMTCGFFASLWGLADSSTKLSPPSQSVVEALVSLVFPVLCVDTTASVVWALG